MSQPSLLVEVIKYTRLSALQDICSMFYMYIVFKDYLKYILLVKDFR